VKLEVNSQGYYRVLLPNGSYMTDVDLMSVCSNNHVSSIMKYATKASALKGYAYYEELRARTGKPFERVYIENDWVLETPKLKNSFLCFLADFKARMKS
jgi:hypothetical protein